MFTNKDLEAEIKKSAEGAADIGEDMTLTKKELKRRRKRVRFFGVLAPLFLLFHCELDLKLQANRIQICTDRIILKLCS